MSRILVIGATGRQGGAVTRVVLDNGHSVVALVRDPDAPAERALQDRGVEVVVGTLDVADSIATAARGVDSIFAMTTPFAGLDTEVRHGMNIVSAVVAVGDPHLVFSSVASAHRDTGISHFASKRVIEQRISSLDAPWTVVAPVFFMDNYLFANNLADLGNGVLRQAVDVDKPLQLIDSNDIGRFAGLVLDDPSQFAGKRIEIAGDEATGSEIAAALSDGIGSSVRYQEQPLAELDAFGGDWRRMYEWFNETGFEVDRERLAADYPDFRFTSLSEFAAAQDWDVLFESAPALH